MMDLVEKKIGLSIKAALDEPEESSVQAYHESQQGDGTATLGDLMGPDVLGRGMLERRDGSDDSAAGPSSL